ncbi:MAG: hypothetical protein Q8L48_06590 [Archangium sp.]|nr:hypothetical protein [Archangium sp.]
MESSNRISLTPTVARQTPKNEFGNVLKNALQTAANAGGALLNSVPGAGIISAAVSNVTALASNGGSAQASFAATGVTAVGSGGGAMGGATGQALATSPNGVPTELTGMIGQMRAEADRSTMMQMQMQQESREYNTISNVLKVRHDSAKSAINNIR